MITALKEICAITQSVAFTKKCLRPKVATMCCTIPNFNRLKKRKKRDLT